MPHVGKRVELASIDGMVKLLFSRDDKHDAASLQEAFEKSNNKTIKMLLSTLKGLNENFKKLITEHQ